MSDAKSNIERSDDLHTDQFELGTLIWHEYDNHADLADDLAAELTERFRQCNNNNEIAWAAFSGGSTPKPLFQALASQAYDWTGAQLTLVDERWVDVSDELSNERFIREHFLSKLRPQPIFMPLFAPADNVQESLLALQERYLHVTQTRSSLTLFDSVVLGMGGDGHTASFFPDASNVRELVTYDSEVQLQTCISQASQVARITWSLAALLATDYLVLHITGREKRELFERATKADKASMANLMELPIRSVAYQSRVPLHIYYSD